MVPKKQQMAVIGAGLMGHGIALTLARAGQYVTLTDPHEETLKSAPKRISDSLKSLGAAEDEIARALKMPLAKRKARWEKLIDNVRKEDVMWWCELFITALEDAPEHVEA